MGRCFGHPGHRHGCVGRSECCVPRGSFSTPSTPGGRLTWVALPSTPETLRVRRTRPLLSNPKPIPFKGRGGVSRSRQNLSNHHEREDAICVPAKLPGLCKQIRKHLQTIIQTRHEGRSARETMYTGSVGRPGSPAECLVSNHAGQG